MTHTSLPHVPDLPTGTRILLLVFGWLLVAVGILGLLLPGIQGILTLALGCAVLSLASRTALRVLQWVTRPWPRLWTRMLALRRKALRWVLGSRRKKPPESAPGED